MNQKIIIIGTLSIFAIIVVSIGLNPDFQTGTAKALGMLFVGLFMYAAYNLSNSFFSNQTNESIKDYFSVLFKCLIAVMIVSYTMATLNHTGGCDDDGECQSGSTTPIAEDFAYYATLFGIPALIGIYTAKQKNSDK